MENLNTKAAHITKKSFQFSRTTLQKVSLPRRKVLHKIMQVDRYDGLQRFLSRLSTREKSFPILLAEIEKGLNLTLYLVFCMGRFCPLFWCLHSELPFEGPSMGGGAVFLSPPSQRCSSSSSFLPRCLAYIWLTMANNG